MDRPSKNIMRLPRVAALVIASLLCHSLAAETLRSSVPQEQAEFLAGIPLPQGNLLQPLQKSPEYRQHQKELQEQWGFCRRIRYEAMQQWARDHLSRQPATRGVLRYLFGGPDFLNAYAFFPDTRVMVLGGLEPVGEVPPPEALDPNALGVALKALDEALHTSLFCGYFITSEMKPQLGQGSFRGVLPVLYTELALTGNVIDSVQMVRPFGSPGVQIIYHRPGGSSQTLFYFQADLSNGKECRRFLSWLGDLGPGASYLKAASYLLPLDSFSETRNFLLRTSSLILQDDSGLPFRSFLPGEWQIQLFGVYTDPLPIFKLKREPALEAAYRSSVQSGALPFGAGYHVNPSDANLLLAVRNSPQSVPPVPVIAADSAPPAVPAFASPTPRPKRVRIRKALPVPIRKAIPVKTTETREVAAPVLSPPPVAVELVPSTPPPKVVSTPVVLAPEDPPQPSQPTRTTEAIGECSPDQATIAPPETESAPMATPPVTEQTPALIPLTSGGKPID
jgi:hypothetical protein